ncbi:fungal-specific transcription factor domain-containing protein [Amylocarpus encephaloides]|uniref:Fungal-specific transcription factor domain-containing protein n=1 Tax=Amylocarpus encephaloides TaxID=45428 RepID=A0A9P7YT14_9HELO|nr:fungal-specific transcription factor domain-containing protein [Amylocarpus encephaloides]
MSPSGPSAADTPLLRVSRPVSACSRCRSAKIKCDGKLPACTACEKSGRAGECSSANDQFAKGKERSYVASLESRVEKLERRIAYARSRKASVAMHDVDAPVEIPDRKDSLATIRAAIHGKAARRREAADVNELVSDFGFLQVMPLSVNATTRDFESSTTNMTFARMILAATNLEVVPRPEPFRLPSRPAAMGLVQYYLDNVFSIFPVFSETALINALDAIYQDNGRPVTDFERWLFYMVLAIATAGQSRGCGDAQYLEGITWVSRALQYADKVLTPGYVSQIQALVLLVQYSMLDPAHFDSWQLIGFACRAVVDLGFHQDPPRGQQTDKKTLDMRRRVFYCVYSLDRSISMVHARCFSFSDDSTSVDFPALPGNSATANTMTGHHSLEPAGLLFQLRYTQSTWYQELFQSSRVPLQNPSMYTWQVCQDLRDWAESFPDTLSLSFKEFFDLELLYSYVYCLAPSCRIQTVSTYGKTLIFEYSIAYMQKIFPISKDPINTAFYTYHDALRVYFVGSHFLAVLMEDPDSLLNGILPYAAPAAGSAPPPPLPINAGVEGVDRSLKCVSHIKETLKTFGQRWEDSKALLSSFEAQAEPALSDLLHRRRHMDEISRSSHSPPNFLPPPSFEHIRTLSAEDWAKSGRSFSNNGTLHGGHRG